MVKIWSRIPALLTLQPRIHLQSRRDPSGSARDRAAFLSRHLSYAVILSFLFLLPSCAGTIVKNEGLRHKTWACDKEADDALKSFDYERSWILHKEMIKREPLNALALYHLGYTQGRLGNHEKEIMLYEKALSLGMEGDDIFFNLGMAFGELQQYEKSLDAFQRGLALAPQNTDLVFGKALACKELGRDSEAEQALLEVIRMDADHLEARLILSMIYAETHQRQKAIEQLRQVLRSDPNHERARTMMKELERP